MKVFKEADGRRIADPDTLRATGGEEHDTTSRTELCR
jgi:hypothetical protein